jgi:hypothetical protein
MRLFVAVVILLVFAGVGPASAGGDLMLLVDGICWRNPSVTSRTRAAFTRPGFKMQHKSSAPMQTLAVSIHADHDFSAAEIDELKGGPCVQDVAANPRFETVSTGAGTDEFLSQQTALLPLHEREAEGIFYHPLFGIRRTAVIGVVDTGVQLDHPDLVTRLWHGPNGEIGYDFFNGDADPSDDNGHGTHIAGLIGAQRGNGIGVRGIMGDWSRLMPVKTQGADGGGLLADLVNGIRYAVDHGADVINLSIAGRTESTALQQIIEYALAHGTVVVVAAGNDGQEISPSNWITPIGYAPAYPGLIGVGGFDAVSLLPDVFSNHGPAYVEIAAPGSADGDGILSTYTDSGYRALEGTSMSAPQVSGAAALAAAFLKSRGVAYTPADIEQDLELSAVSDPGLSSAFTDGRRLDLWRLSRLLLNTTDIDSTGGFDDK